MGTGPELPAGTGATPRGVGTSVAGPAPPCCTHTCFQLGLWLGPETALVAQTADLSEKLLLK